jgi:sugar lactone lactonase YvrE
MLTMRALLFACLSMVFAIPVLAQNIRTVAGGGPNNLPAVSANLNGPIGAGVDASGNFYIAIQYSKVFRVDTSGQLTLYAGGGYSSADGIPATSADLCMLAMTVDDEGNAFLADGCTSRIRRVDAATRTITTVAGNGLYGYNGDGGPATTAELRTVTAVTLDKAGDLLIADGGRIRRVDAITHVITTVAGNGTLNVNGMSADRNGNLFIADGVNQLIRRIDAVAGVITTVAGNGYQNPQNPFYGGFSGDGGPATSAELNHPTGVTVDGAGNVFIADTFNGRIRRVDAATQVITTVAGNGYRDPSDPCGALGGFSGDGGPATSAALNEPLDVAVDTRGNLFIADYFNNRVRRVDALTGVITTVAGNGVKGFNGDGGPATSAELAGPTSVAIDRRGNLFIAEGNTRVREVFDVVERH